MFYSLVTGEHSVMACVIWSLDWHQFYSTRKFGPMVLPQCEESEEKMM